MSKASDAARQSAIDELRKLIKPGDTIYTQLKHVSRSGMLRVIQLVLLRNNEPRWIGYTAAKAMGYSYDREREGIRVGGCGMDMGFHIVNSLSYALYRDYKCLGSGSGRKPRCPASFHQGEHYNDFTSEPIHHNDGYALNQRWL